MCGSIGAAGLLAGQPLDTGPSYFHSQPLILILIFIFVHLIHLCCTRAAYLLILHTDFGMSRNSIVKVRFQSPQYKGRYPSTWSAIRESSCLCRCDKTLAWKATRERRRTIKLITIVPVARFVYAVGAIVKEESVSSAHVDFVIDLERSRS